MSDFGSIGGDIYTVPLAGGTPRNLTPDYRGTFNGVVWRGAGLLATALIDSQLALVPVDAQAGPAQPVLLGELSSSGSDGRRRPGSSTPMSSTARAASPRRGSRRSSTPTVPPPR